MATWKKRNPNGPANPRLLTFQPRHMPQIFIVWKSGSRAPRSFHTSREEALEAMRAFVKPGEECTVLVAAPDTIAVEAMTVTETAGTQAKRPATAGGA